MRAYACDAEEGAAHQRTLHSSIAGFIHVDIGTKVMVITVLLYGFAMAMRRRAYRLVLMAPRPQLLSQWRALAGADRVVGRCSRNWNVWQYRASIIGVRRVICVTEDTGRTYIDDIVSSSGRFSSDIHGRCWLLPFNMCH